MSPANRDLIGYGRDVPQAHWPNSARIAVNFCLNYEEGAERHIDHGDGESESILHEVGGSPRIGARDLNSESMYEYGSRAGFWRVMACFAERGLDFTINAVGQALTLNPVAAQAIADSGADIHAHGWRWIDYADMPEADERAHIRQTVVEIERLTGRHPVGWYTGRPSLNTRRLVIEEGGFLYDSDSYSDDLPYWAYDYDRPHLILPYSIDTNDSRFFRTSGFVTGDDFFQYNRDAFDILYQEGGRMLTVGLHARLIGRPGRIGGLKRLLDHMMAQPHVWIARREDIARHWIATHPSKEGR
jgi:putative urate catabolism protein